MRIGRNESCYCGSGRKYKKCCGASKDTSAVVGIVSSESPVKEQASQESIRGNVLIRQGKLDEAHDCFLRALKLMPGFSEALLGIGTIHFMSERFEAALEVYKKVVQVKPDSAMILYDFGNKLQERGLYDTAINAYKEALCHMPKESNILTNMGSTLVKAERLDEAIKVLNKAININPDDVYAYRNLAAVNIKKGRLFEAEKILLQGLSKQKDNLATYNILMVLYERLNQLDKSRLYAEKVLNRDPFNPKANLSMATLLRREKKADEGLEMLSRVTIPNDDRNLAMSIHYELGRLSEQLHDSNIAMQHFLRANQLWAENSSIVKDSYRQKVKGIRQSFENNSQKYIATIATSKSTRMSEPIFLVGFPRSGTTLLSQILDCHSEIQVLEEKPVLINVLRQIENRQNASQDILFNLTDNALDNFRDLYWQEAGKHAILPDLQLVDEFPLNIIYCNLIARLFPNARVIVNLRHPCDVCLSCFMQNFKENEAMANFTTLGDTIQFYVDVMGLWLEFEQTLPLAFHRFRYEGLIENFNKEMTMLVNFLGIPLSDNFQKYYLHASNKDNINTASYSQVVEPIYTTARYRWLRYRDHLAPYMTALRPFIEAFGYKEK